MSKENDEFDEIANRPDNGKAPEFQSIMDVLQYYWKEFFPGEIYVKGLFIVESLTHEGKRAIKLETSDPMFEWDMLGLLEWGKARIKADINTDVWIDTVGAMEEAEQKEGDGEEDEDDE